MAKPKGHFTRPPGPLAGFWSWKYLNVLKTIRLVTSRRVRSAYEAFPTMVPLGADFPDIELTTTSGRTVTTRDFRGVKHLVLFTGAIT